MGAYLRLVDLGGPSLCHDEIIHLEVAEQLALFFFPDFATLLETRFKAGRGDLFERQFTAFGERFDSEGVEMALQGGGWSYQEVNKAGIGYQWALGEQAELGLPIAGPEIPVPAASWSSGANILFLRFARSTIPAEVITGSQDRRSLSAAFDYLEVLDETNP